MPGGNRVGRVYYDVDAENNVSKGFAAAEGEAQAFTQSINAMEAKLEVDADLSQLKKDVAVARALKDEMEAEWEQLDLEMGIKKGDIKRMKEAGQETRKANQELQAMERQQSRIENSIKRNTVAQKLYNAQLGVRKDEARRINDVVKAEKAHARSIDKVGSSTKKEAFEIAKLEEKYIKLRDARRKADQGIRGLHSTADKARLGRIDAERGMIRERLGLLGKTEDELRVLDRSVDSNNDRWLRWGQSIAGTRLHVGFFSTTITGFFRILAAFGPVILSIIGSLGALVGVAGAGIAGALAVGGAALTGFGLAAVGVGFALREPIHQLGVAWKASTAYADAVQKYGKNSTQAADKQDQLNNAIKGLPPQAQKAIKELGTMRQRFMQLGGDQIRSDFFTSFAQGIKTASALLPTFARGSARVFHQVSKGFDDWMKGLRGPEAKNILSDIFKGASDFVPGLMAGLGNLASAFGRVSQAASHFLGSLGDGFATWTQGIEDAVGSGDQLTARVGSWVKSMQQVGHFTQAAAASLTTLFSIGAGPGGGFLDSMTRSLQRWNAEMKRDPKGTRDFFQQSVDTMRQLGPALGRILMTLANLAEALAPATEFVSGFLNTLTQGLTALSNIPIGKQVVQIAALAFVLNKLGTAIAVSGLLGGGAAAAAGGAGGLLGRIFSRGGTRAAAQATGQLALFGEEATASGVAAGGLAAGALGILGPAALAVGGLYLLGQAVGDDETHFEQAKDAIGRYAKKTADLPAALNATTKATRANINAEKDSTDAKRKLFQVTKQFAEGKASYAEVQQAQQKQTAAQQRQTDATKKQANAAARLADDSKRVQAAQEAVNQAQKAAKTTRLSKLGKTEVEAAAGSTERLARANKDLAAAQSQQNFDNINQARSLNGLKPIAQDVANQFHALEQVMGRANATKLAIGADPQDTAKISKLVANIQKLGGTHKAKLILEGSKSPEQAIKQLTKLDHAQLHKKVLRIESAAAAKAAEDNLSKVDAKKLKQKALRVLTNTGNVTKALAVIEGKKLKDKEQKFKPGSTAAVTAAYNALSSKPDIIIPVVFQAEHRGNFNPKGGYAGGIVPGRAGGGYFDQMMERAYARADRAAGLNPSRGARVNSPRYVVGEEPGQTEYIITDNPAYRRSNLLYLSEAASALGTSIPGFGRGGSPKASAAKKKKKKKKNQPGEPYAGQDLDDATDENSDYQLSEDRVDLLDGLAGLARRNYDLGTAGYTIDSVTSAIGAEIGEYSHLAGIINTIITGYPGNSKVHVPDVGKAPKKRKHESDKSFKKRKKKYDDAKAKADAKKEHNEQARSGRQDLKAEMDNINQVIIPGLYLDQLEASNAAATNTLLGAETTNLARENLFRQFAGNIFGGGGAVAPSLGPHGLGSMSTTPALASLGASATGGGAVGTRSAAAPAGKGDISIVQNFDAPPPDPHTWARGVAFEIGAAG